MILKSETKTEDMVSILEDLHSYVPTTSMEQSVEVPGQDVRFTVTADDFHHTLLGKPYNYAFHRIWKEVLDTSWRKYTMLFCRWRSVNSCQSTWQSKSEK